MFVYCQHRPLPYRLYQVVVVLDLICNIANNGLFYGRIEFLDKFCILHVMKYLCTLFSCSILLKAKNRCVRLCILSISSFLQYINQYIGIIHSKLFPRITFNYPNKTSLNLSHSVVVYTCW